MTKNIFDNRFHWLNNRFLLTGTFCCPAGFGTPGLICANHVRNFKLNTKLPFFFFTLPIWKLPFKLHLFIRCTLLSKVIYSAFKIYIFISMRILLGIKPMTRGIAGELLWPINHPSTDLIKTFLKFRTITVNVLKVLEKQNNISWSIMSSSFTTRSLNFI